MFANFIWDSQIERCNFQQSLSFPSLFQSYKISLHHIPPWTGAKQPIKSFPFDMLAAWVVLKWHKTFVIWTSSSASLSRQKSNLLLLVCSVLCTGALAEQRSLSVWCSPWQALSWDQYLRMYLTFPVYQWSKVFLAHCFPFGLLTFSLCPLSAQLHKCLQQVLIHEIEFYAWSQISYASNTISAN